MNNDILKQLVEKIDTITLEKCDAVVIHYNHTNLDEANYIRNTLMHSQLFEKYGKRKIGVIMVPDSIKVEVKEKETMTMQKPSAFGPSEMIL